MKKKKSPYVVFKPYLRGQLQLPTDLEELVPAEHVVRVVDGAIEKMDLSPLLRQYKGGGTSSYHPKMMLKVLVYAYTQRIYSSRQIAKALRENVYFMWLSGQNRPDFRTINRFRSTVMWGIMDKVFSGVVRLLIEEGYVKLEHYFLDGTKIEANANRYRAVWAKSTRRYKRQLQEKIRTLLDEIERVNEAENEEYGDRDLEEMGGHGPIDAEKLEKTIQELNEQLKQEPQDQKLAKAVRTLEREYLPRQKKYEEQEKKLGERNSFSKTDEDATMMRMKGDPPKLGQPKAGYNVQIGTESEFVVGYSLHPRPGDTKCLVPHLEALKGQLGRLPKNVIADAGYGSEENYAYLEGEQVKSYVKYNTFDREQRKTRRRGLFQEDDFVYDTERDEWVCPANRRLTYRSTELQPTESGYILERRRYECEDCGGCPVRSQCTRGEGNRQLEVSFELQRMRAQARENLLSDEGKALRSRRGVEVEGVFGRLKHNWGFRRFLLRGREKVQIEWGLLCIAHNLAKITTLLQSRLSFLRQRLPLLRPSYALAASF
jgi:transposase